MCIHWFTPLLHNSLLYLRTYRTNILHFTGNYNPIVHIHICNQNFGKGYLPNTLVTPSKLKEILIEVRMALQTNKPDYELGDKQTTPIL